MNQRDLRDLTRRVQELEGRGTPAQRQAAADGIDEAARRQIEDLRFHVERLQERIEQLESVIGRIGDLADSVDEPRGDDGVQPPKPAGKKKAAAKS